MVNVGRLPGAERIAIAQLSGVAARHARGRGDGDPVAELHSVSRDPRLLGIAAAACLVQADRNRHEAEALRLLRAAGADEQVIAEHAEQVRYWLGLETWRMSQWGSTRHGAAPGQ